MCEHLLALENEILKEGIKETYRGPAWGEGTREWAYFDCYLDTDKLRKRFNLPDFITCHVNNDPKSGLEEGFVCEKCKDAIMGLNRNFPHTDKKRTIE
jgi:hypothetical protein